MSLIVSCPNGTSKDTKRVVSGIVNLMTEHLERKGMDGEWELELFKKTGGGGQDRLAFKRKAERIEGQDALLYQIRPQDRDSSWTVIVYPPLGCDIDKLISEEPDHEPEPEKAEVPGVVCENQIYAARVKSHQEHGFEVDIEAKGGNVVGFVSLADLGSGYDRKALNKYAVGKGIKVLVCDSTRSPVTCSTRVDVVLTTTNSKDVFTGALNKDGSLPLKAFTKDYKRIFDLLQELIAAVMLASKENFIERETAISTATEYLKAKYSAKSILPNVVPCILQKLCRPMECMPMPVLSNVEKDGVSGYALTQFAWDELGGMDSLLSDGKAEPEPEPEEHETAIVGLDTVPESQLETQLETVEPEPAPPIGPEEAKACVDSAAAQLEEAAMYFGKLCRLNELNSQIEALQAERDSLQGWLENNKDMKDSVIKFQSMSVSRDRCRELAG